MYVCCVYEATREKIFFHSRKNGRFSKTIHLNRKKTRIASETSVYSSQDENDEKSGIKFEFYVNFSSRNREITERRLFTGLFQREK